MMWLMTSLTGWARGVLRRQDTASVQPLASAPYGGGLPPAARRGGDGADERAARGMLEFQGVLSGVGLPALVRFLVRLQKSGRLRLTQDRWSGSLEFDRGNLVAAALGDERGCAALDALALLFPDARFAFAEGASTEGGNVDLSSQALHDHLEELSGQIARTATWHVPPLEAQWIVAPHGLAGAGSKPDRIVLDRTALQTLLAVNRGRRTAMEIAGSGTMIGVADTVAALERLRDLGLIQVQDNGTAAYAVTLPPVAAVVPP